MTASKSRQEAERRECRVRQFVLLIGFVFLAVAAGCGGGSARGPVPSSAVSPGASLSKYQVTVRIDAPKSTR
jgi:hypothetical protein